MSRYQRLFDRLAARAELAFIPFVMLGDPDPALSLEIVRALVAGGADALELGFPFSDPVADGPTIQAASVRALAAGVTPAICWTLLAAIRGHYPDLPIGLLVYANLVVNHGLEDFYSQAARAGVDSVLVADVPTLEVTPFVAAALAQGIDPVLIAPPNAGEATLQRIARDSRGYTYVTARSGVTGAAATLDYQAPELLSRLHELGAPPSVLGFGISTPGHLRAARELGVAGAISGSAVIAHVERHLAAPAELVPTLTRFCREMKAASAPAGIPSS